MAASIVGIKLSVKGAFLEFAGNKVNINKRVQEKLQDFTPFWTKERPVMEENFRKVWNEGQYTWPPNSRAWTAYKAKMGYSTKIMHMTGKLVRAMVYGQEEVKAPTVWTWGIDRTNGEWYSGKSSRPYPEIQAETRPFAVILKDTFNRIVDDWVKYIKAIAHGKY
jgi:hypothetical protein